MLVGGSAQRTTHSSQAADELRHGQLAQAMANVGASARYTELRGEIMNLTECSKRTAQLAITDARREGRIVQVDGQYRLPL